MCDTPAVSVIIPTRNCLRYLPLAVASIGPAPDAEIIIFNDGSTDGTAEWLEQAARADGRIVVLEGTGIGPSKARNRAIAVARAPLLAFLDADDIWYPEKLSIQLALHRAWPEIGFSFTDYRHITQEGDVRGSCFAYWPRFRERSQGRSEPFALGGDALAQIFAENVVGTSTVMARTDLVRALGGFANDLPSSEDWDLWLRLASRSQVMCVPRVLADYLMHRPGNLTGNLRARVLAMRIIGVRHKAAVGALDRSALREFNARIREGEAEIARSSAKYTRAFLSRVAALALAPSVRAAREAACAAVQMLRRRSQPGQPG